MINELNEEIDKEDIEYFINRILKLSDNKIDELWFNLNWIREDNGKNKALPKRVIDKMRKNRTFAILTVESLLSETYREDFLSELDEMENKK